jgi:hypothetical protein
LRVEPVAKDRHRESASRDGTGSHHADFFPSLCC